jgi:hypothetical protein
MASDGRPGGRSRRSPSTAAVLGSVAVAVLGLSACGPIGGPTPTGPPAPSPAATLSPSPAPDVERAFLAQVADPSASGAAEITGAVIAGDEDGTASGELVFDGPNLRSTLTVTIGDAELVAERVQLGSEAWEHVSPGPWLATDRAADDRSLPAMLASIRSVEDIGTIPSAAPDGAPIHRLRPTEATAWPAAAFGLVDPAMAGAELTVEFEATSDGTPRTILVDAAWSQALDGQRAAVTARLEIAIVRWQAVVSIRPPEEVWAVHTSDAIGYTMAHPRDWTVRAGDEADAFGLGGVEYLNVATQPLTEGATLDQFREAVVRSAATELGGPPDADEAVLLGGAPARRLTYHLTNDAGNPIVLVDYLAVRDARGWEVYLATVAGDDEAAELTFFETFIATFRFVR